MWLWIHGDSAGNKIMVDDIVIISTDKPPNANHGILGTRLDVS